MAKPSIETEVKQKVEIKTGIGVLLTVGIGAAASLGLLMAATPLLRVENPIDTGTEPVTPLISELSGWPQTLPSYTTASPLAVNLDTDAELEIVQGAKGTISAYDRSGKVLTGWPIRLAEDSFVQSAKTSTKLDSDPQAEIVFSVSRWYGTATPSVYVVNHDGTPLPGWPKQFTSDVYEAPVVADLNKDGFDEVAVIAGTALHVYDRTGAELTGWPHALEPYNMRTVGAGDLNADGSVELIAAEGDQVSAFTSAGEAFGSCWPIKFNLGTDDLGTPIYGRPFTPAIGDLDGDGSDEVVFTIDRTDAQFPRYVLYAINEDCSNVPGFPADISGAMESSSVPVMGDVDGDKKLEIVMYIGFWDAICDGDMCEASYIRIWNHDGSTFGEDSPWLTWVAPIQKPSLADINNDGKLEIFGFSKDDNLYGWDYAHKTLRGFPLVGAHGGGVTQPAFADVDANRTAEMIVSEYTYPSKLHVYKVSGSRAGQLWPMLQHDVMNSSTIPALKAAAEPIAE
ncbi:MAG: VCBS repeat-containing protein [Patescibacteria group bacterium]|nr:VCBS repeat-containing protein [Patescibacteria group bacterium]MDD5715288.1 VCBS repeat-containing protein [Patescibacteria group bacterium]